MDPVPLNDHPSHHCLPSWWSRTWLVGGGHLVSSVLLCGCQLCLLAACHSIDTSSPPPQANSMCLCGFWLTGVLVGPPLPSVESNPGKKEEAFPKEPWAKLLTAPEEKRCGEDAGKIEQRCTSLHLRGVLCAETATCISMRVTIQSLLCGPLWEY